MKDTDFIDKLALLYIVDRKLLVVLAHGKDAYFMPGGKREESETDKEALVRELKEELNIDLDSDTAEFFTDYLGPAHGKPANVKLRIRCYTGVFTGALIPSNEIKEFGWVTSEDIGLPHISEIGNTILNDLKHRDLID